MTGKCPACGQLVTRLDLNGLSASGGFGAAEWKAVTFNCPRCHAVLGAQIDPITLKTDIVNQTVRELMKALGR